MPDEIYWLTDYFADYVVGVVIAVRTREHHYAEFHFGRLRSFRGADWECRSGVRKRHYRTIGDWNLASRAYEGPVSSMPAPNMMQGSKPLLIGAILIIEDPPRPVKTKPSMPGSVVQFNAEIFYNRVGEHVSGHAFDLGACLRRNILVEGNLEVLTLSNVFDPGIADRLHGVMDGLPLRVEHRWF